MRLWVQLATFMAGVAIIPLLVTGLFATKISVTKSRQAAEEILGRDAQEAAALVGTWVHDQRQTLAGWMKPYRLTDSPAHQEALLKAVYIAVPSVSVLVLTDGSGQPITEPFYLTQEVEGSALEGRQVVSKARAETLVDRLPELPPQETGAIGEPYLPPGAAYPSVPIVVRGPHDASLRLGAEVSLDVLAAALQKTTSEDHAVALLGADGSAVIGGGHPLVDTARTRPLLGTDVTFRLTQDPGIAGAVAVVPYTDWTVMVGEPMAMVYGTSSEIRTRVNEVLFVSILLAISAGAVIGRSWSKPIGNLRDSVHAIKDGDYDRRVAVNRDDELGDLAAAFNDMAATLSHNRTEINAQRSEIEAFNRELQQRVEERTTELRAAQKRLVQSGQLAAVAHVGAGLAHELNNPLAAILGLTQLVRSASEDDGERQRLRQIEAQAERCRQVVAAMLRFSSGEAVDPRQAPVIDMAKVLQEVVGLVRGPFRRSGVAVDLTPLPDNLEVRIDPVLASRILAPILGSLGAGLGTGEAIQVGAEVSGDEVVVTFTPDRPVAIVESARDDWMASGMGMWVARRMLDQVGGFLEEPAPPRRSWRVFLPGPR